MKKSLVLASGNKSKILEIQELLKHLEIQISSMAQEGIQDDIEETGQTLDHNSWIKSAYVYDKLGKNTLAEDTGLEVICLNNEPGVYSARYAGTQKNSDDNMNLLLQNLKDKADRSAQFRTVATLVWDHSFYQFEGIATGQITKQRQGNHGFGYDPIFMPDGYSITFAQMSKKEKNKISHRGIAIRKVINFIQSRYKNLK